SVFTALAPFAVKSGPVVIERSPRPPLSSHSGPYDAQLGAAATAAVGRPAIRTARVGGVATCSAAVARTPTNRHCAAAAAAGPSALRRATPALPAARGNASRRSGPRSESNSLH